MRHQGRITEWNDDRGFGFITPGGGGERVFLHISAFSARVRRPQINDRVTYTVVAGPKGPKANGVEMLDVPTPSRHSGSMASKPTSKRAGSRLLPGVLAVLAIAAAASWLLGRQSTRGSGAANTLLEAQPHRVDESATNTPAFQCQGKTHCSEMTSCEEAQFYLSHCPGSVTDGDGDGLPCEDQWCGH